MHDLTGIQRDLLSAIAGLDDPHGPALKAELDAYYTEAVPHNRLYPSLDALVNKGLVVKRQPDQHTDRYSLTRRGQRALQARLEWEAHYFDPD